MKSLRAIGLSVLTGIIFAGIGGTIFADALSHHSGNHGAGRVGHVKVLATTTSFIRETLGLAKQGKVRGIPFSVDSSVLDNVESVWGKPSQEDVAGPGIYATYRTKNVAFGFNKGMQIFDVRSYATQFKHLSLADVISVLGAPGDTRYYGQQKILLYPAGPDYQLLWVFSASKTSNPLVDHVSVFCPRDTVNSMAINVPDPTAHILLDGNGTLKFDLRLTTKSYPLSELEWVTGSARNTVVETAHQIYATKNVGDRTPHFTTSGSSFMLHYPISMKGESGTIVAIFQSTSGQALYSVSTPVILH